MSAAPQVGLTYEVRADLRKLASDMRQQEQMAAQSARKMRSESEAILSKAIVTEVRFRENLDSMERTRFAATKSGAAAGASPGGVEGALRGANQVGEAFEKIGKAALISTAAIEAGNLALHSTQLLAATVKGDFDGQVAAANQLRDAIASLPGFGQKIVSLGETINRLTIDKITGEHRYADEAARAADQLNRQTAIVEKLVKAKADFNNKFGQFSGDLLNDVHRQERSEVDGLRHDIETKQRQLAEFLAKPEARDKKGALTETAKAFRDQAQDAISGMAVLLEQKVYQMRQKTHAEIEALKAENSGDKQLAEDIKFAEERRQAELEAGKKSAEALEMEKLKTAELSTKRDLERTKKAEEEKLKMAKDRAEQAAGIERDIFDMHERERRAQENNARRVDELRAETQSIKDASGGKHQARLNEIEREFQRIVLEKGVNTFGVPSQDQAVIAAARERADAQRLEAVAEETRRREALRPEVISGAAATMANLFGAKSGGDTVQHALTKQTNSLLAVIAQAYGDAFIARTQ